jgi:hypothetical protein
MKFFQPHYPASVSELFDEHLSALIREHCLQVENLTKEQFLSALKQAIGSGDFKRLIHQSGQQVIYVPYAEKCALKQRIEELESLLESVWENIPKEILAENLTANQFDTLAALKEGPL